MIIPTITTITRCTCPVPVSEGEAQPAEEGDPAVQGQGQGGQGPASVQEEVLAGHGEPAYPFLAPQGPLKQVWMCCYCRWVIVSV